MMSEASEEVVKMRGFCGSTLLICRKELSGYIYSTAGHVVITLNALMFGAFFTIFIELLNQVATNVPITELFYDSYFFWILLLVGIPVITTRAFSLEASRGTLDSTLATPISTASLVTGKWLGCLIFFLVTWLPWIGCMIVIYFIPSQPPPFEWIQWVTTGFGLVLIGSFFVAIGCFFSSLTPNQIISAMATLVTCLSLFGLSFIDKWANPNESTLQSLISQLGIVNHMGDFVRGILDSRPITFYISSTALLLYLTVLAIERKRWKA